MLPLRIYGTTSRQAFSRLLRRCVAQQGPTAGVVKPGGGMNMWERSLLPSGKLLRHGRLVKALEPHTMQPNALQDVQCIMLAKTLTRRSTRILNQSLQNYTALQTSLEKNADVVKNNAGEMSMSDDSKQKAWLEHYQRLLNAEFDWDPNHLSDESPVEGPPIPVTIDMVKKAISQMKAGKAPGPSGIV